MVNGVVPICLPHTSMCRRATKLLTDFSIRGRLELEGTIREERHANGIGGRTPGLRAKIDASGRIVLPAEVRSAFGLRQALQSPSCKIRLACTFKRPSRLCVPFRSISRNSYRRVSAWLMKSFRSTTPKWARAGIVTGVVLDASAFLAYALKERGADVVRPKLFGAIMSAVNYSEVLKKTVERGGDMWETAALLQGARVEVVPFGAEQAADAAELFDVTRSVGLSFADRACLSLAIELDASLYTAEKRLAQSDARIDVVLIREPAVAARKRGSRSNKGLPGQVTRHFTPTLRRLSRQHFVMN